MLDERERVVKLDKSSLELMNDIIKKDKLYQLLWGVDKKNKNADLYDNYNSYHSIVPHKPEKGRETPETRNHWGYLLMPQFNHRNNNNEDDKIENKKKELKDDNSESKITSQKSSIDMDFFEFMLADDADDEENEEEEEDSDDEFFRTDERDNLLNSLFPGQEQSYFRREALRKLREKNNAIDNEMGSIMNRRKSSYRMIRKQKSTTAEGFQAYQENKLHEIAKMNSEIKLLRLNEATMTSKKEILANIFWKSIIMEDLQFVKNDVEHQEMDDDLEFDYCSTSSSGDSPSSGSSLEEFFGGSGSDDNSGEDDTDKKEKMRRQRSSSSSYTNSSKFHRRLASSKDHSDKSMKRHRLNKRQHSVIKLIKRATSHDDEGDREYYSSSVLENQPSTMSTSTRPPKAELTKEEMTEKEEALEKSIARMLRYKVHEAETNNNKREIIRRELSRDSTVGITPSSAGQYGLEGQEGEIDMVLDEGMRGLLRMQKLLLETRYSKKKSRLRSDLSIMSMDGGQGDTPRITGSMFLNKGGMMMEGSSPKMPFQRYNSRISSHSLSMMFKSLSSYKLLEYDTEEEEETDSDENDVNNPDNIGLVVKPSKIYHKRLPPIVNLMSHSLYYRSSVTRSQITPTVVMPVLFTNHEHHPSNKMYVAPPSPTERITNSDDYESNYYITNALKRKSYNILQSPIRVHSRLRIVQDEEPNDQPAGKPFTEEILAGIFPTQPVKPPNYLAVNARGNYYSRYSKSSTIQNSTSTLNTKDSASINDSSTMLTDSLMINKCSVVSDDDDSDEGFSDFFAKKQKQVNVYDVIQMTPKTRSSGGSNKGNYMSNSILSELFGSDSTPTRISKQYSRHNMDSSSSATLNTVIPALSNNSHNVINNTFNYNIHAKANGNDKNQESDKNKNNSDLKRTISAPNPNATKSRYILSKNKQRAAAAASKSPINDEMEDPDGGSTQQHIIAEYQQYPQYEKPKSTSSLLSARIDIPVLQPPEMEYSIEEELPTVDINAIINEQMNPDGSKQICITDARVNSTCNTRRNSEVFAGTVTNPVKVMGENVAVVSYDQNTKQINYFKYVDGVVDQTSYPLESLQVTESLFKDMVTIRTKGYESKYICSMKLQSWLRIEEQIQRSKLTQEQRDEMEAERRAELRRKRKAKIDNQFKQEILQNNHKARPDLPNVIQFINQGVTSDFSDSEREYCKNDLLKIFRLTSMRQELAAAGAAMVDSSYENENPDSHRTSNSRSPQKPTTSSSTARKPPSDWDGYKATLYQRPVARRHHATGDERVRFSGKDQQRPLNTRSLCSTPFRVFGEENNNNDDDDNASERVLNINMYPFNIEPMEDESDDDEYISESSTSLVSHHFLVNTKKSDVQNYFSTSVLPQISNNKGQNVPKPLLLPRKSTSPNARSSSLGTRRQRKEINSFLAAMERSTFSLPNAIAYPTFIEVERNLMSSKDVKERRRQSQSKYRRNQEPGSHDESLPRNVIGYKRRKKGKKKKVKGQSHVEELLAQYDMENQLLTQKQTIIGNKIIPELPTPTRPSAVSSPTQNATLGTRISERSKSRAGTTSALGLRRTHSLSSDDNSQNPTTLTSPLLSPHRPESELTSKKDSMAAAAAAAVEFLARSPKEKVEVNVPSSHQAALTVPSVVAAPSSFISLSTSESSNTVSSSLVPATETIPPTTAMPSPSQPMLPKQSKSTERSPKANLMLQKLNLTKTPAPLLDELTISIPKEKDMPQMAAASPSAATPTHKWAGINTLEELVAAENRNKLSLERDENLLRSKVEIIAELTKPEPEAPGVSEEDPTTPATNGSTADFEMGPCQLVMLIEPRRLAQLQVAERLLRLDRLVDVHPNVTLGMYALSAYPKAYGLVLVSLNAVENNEQRADLSELLKLSREDKYRHLSVIIFGNKIVDKELNDEATVFQQEKLRLSELEALLEAHERKKDDDIIHVSPAP